MKQQHYDLNYIETGKIIEVTLGYAANVRVLDHPSYQDYKAGNKHRYIGGYVTRSPYRVPIPSGGHWHVIVDLGGNPGTLSSSVRVLPGALPFVSGQPLAAAAASLYLGKEPNALFESKKDYDVFIAHVPDDKTPVVFPFAFALRTKNLRVWYEEFELKTGDGLNQKISVGVNNSFCGIVVISRSMIKQGWVEAGITDQIIKPFSGKQVLLPVWHDIMRSEVLEFCPNLADAISRNTAVSTFDEIADDIANLIKV